MCFWILLVGGTEEVVDGLHGVEGADGHFNQYGVPVAHRTVPEAGQLKGFDLNTLTALLGNEACGFVNVVGKIEFVALPVFCAYHKINRIEMG